LHSACGSETLIAAMERSTQLHSPNYPESYPSHTECWWTITAQPGHRVQIEFVTFQLEQCCDKLQACSMFIK